MAWIIPLLGGVRGGSLSPFPVFTRTSFTRTRVVKSLWILNELPTYPPLNPLPRGEFLPWTPTFYRVNFAINGIGRYCPNKFMGEPAGGASTATVGWVEARNPTNYSEPNRWVSLPDCAKWAILPSFEMFLPHFNGQNASKYHKTRRKWAIFKSSPHF